MIAAIRERPETARLSISGYFNPRPLGRDLLRFLTENGVHLSLTVDHVSDAVLAANGKNFRRRHLEQLVDSYSDLGVPLSFSLLLGQPGETHQTVDEVLRFIDTIPDRIRGTIYVSPGVRVYPETPLAKRLLDGSLDRRWLRGQIALGGSRTPVPVYCESWEPLDLLRYVVTQSGGRISPMNPYIGDVDPIAFADAQRAFEDFHVGLAEAARGNSAIAWTRWQHICPDTPFLRSGQRREFLWERGLLALQRDAPADALSDWSTLERELARNNASGPGLSKLEHNIALARRLLRQSETECK